MKVFLLNDTASVPHTGCQAVSDAHARLLGAAGHEVVDRAFAGDLRAFAAEDEKTAIRAVLVNDPLRARIEACDAVVVNGGGTPHHGLGVEWLACLGAAQRLGKATLIVNALFTPQAGWRNVLAQLDDFCVQDVRSLRLAHTMGHPRCRLVPDSIAAARFDQPAWVDLKEHIVVTDWHPARDADVGETLRAILQAVEGTYYLPLLHGVQAHVWRGMVNTIARASILITGCHHGIYLAMLARKPFIALPSATPQIEGLLEAAEARIPVCVSPADVEAAFKKAVEDDSEYERVFDWLGHHLPLSTFDALGSGSAPADEAREVARLYAHIGARVKLASTAHWGLGSGRAQGLHLPG
jgi:hypothetical protein